MQRSTTLLFLLALSWQSQAGWVVVSDFALWSNTYNSDTIRISTPGGVSNPDNCAESDSYMVSPIFTLEEAPDPQSSTADLEATIQKQHVLNRIYSTLLAAKMSGKPEKLYLDDCYRNRPAVRNVIIERIVELCNQSSILLVLPYLLEYAIKLKNLTIKSAC